MTDGIAKKVIQGLGQIGTETAEKSLEHLGQIGSSIITGKELLGNLPVLSDEELAKKNAEEEQKKQKEMTDLRSQISEKRRDVEGEIEQVRNVEQQNKKQEEEEFLENLRKQREAEEVERQQLNNQNEMSSNPAKRKKSRGSAFIQGKKKTNQPDPAAMSQTNEKTGGKID